MNEITEDAVVTLREITEATVREICRLSDTLTENHRRMVAPNSVSIAEAYFNEHAWFRAIYAGETPVGFVMLYIGPDDPPNEQRTIYYLWRYMIAASYQGKGYGRLALELVIAHVRKLGAAELLVSVGEGEGNPEGFYRALGFERDGLMYDDEVGMRLVFPAEAQPSLARRQLYFFDPERREFEASIVEQFPLGGGRIGVVLDRTWFYPTGGGQEHDLGMIGDSRVLDVYKDEERQWIVHVVDAPLSAGSVHAAIDDERRARHMQHHTAQHLLSACFVEHLGLETISANINGDSPSTLDLDGPEPDSETLRRVETEANRVVWEDRAVSTYFAAPERLSELPLRKAPKVDEDIRIVEIEGLDWSPCGGTHVAATGSIGAIKIVRTEKVKEKTRIHFVAGVRALELFQAVYATAAGLAAELTVGLPDVADSARRQIEVGRSAQRELAHLHTEMIALEAQRLFLSAEARGERRVVVAKLDGRSMNDLRSLARELLSNSQVVAVLASGVEGKASLVAACAEDSGLRADELLRRLLPMISGRGGGDASLAQGGGAATSEQVDELLEAARRAV